MNPRFQKSARICALVSTLLNLIFYSWEVVLFQMNAGSVPTALLIINALYLLGALLLFYGQRKEKMLPALSGAFCALGAFWWTLLLPADTAQLLLRSTYSCLQTAGLSVSVDLLQALELILPVLSLAFTSYYTRFLVKKPTPIRFSDVPPEQENK